MNSTDRPIDLRASLAGFTGGVGKGARYVLRSAGADNTAEVLNSRDEPDRVRVFTESAGVKGDEFTLQFAAFGVTLYELALAKPTRPSPKR